MSRLLACLVVAHAAGTRATMCANDSTFAATVILGNESFTCDVINTFIWAPQRASAASDAAACDAVLDASPVKVTLRSYATACCGGADDSVCGAAPNVCANPATFNGAATVNLGDESIACISVNAFWGGQRGSAASDAAACDAVWENSTIKNKVAVWAYATDCCGGADDSVCGAAPNVCANPATFNGAATVNLGDESIACDVINTFWGGQRGSAASDAAACDAVSDEDDLNKVIVWAAATACCGGADDSVCGAAPNVCANPATFNSAATVNLGDDTYPCDAVNAFWGGQRASAASDAAACDAVSDAIPVKVTLWAAATACCSGADDSVCGAPPTTCDALAACDDEDPETKGVSAACYEAAGGIIALSGNDAPAWAVSCPETSGPAEVLPACKSGVCSALAACPGSKACASFAGCPDGCVSVNARQRRHLLFGSVHAKCPKGCAEKGMLAQSAGPN